MAEPSLLDRLAAHRTLAGVPREQLQWLASRSHLHQLEAGHVVARKGEPIEHLYVLLSGHLSISVNHGAGLRKVMEWRGGDVSGLLPYSRLAAAPGNSMTEEPTEVLMVHRDHFPEMIRECCELTEVMVHVMVDRARHFRSRELQDEKMLSLGKISAGLAHELNNPASAVARSAKSLASGLADLEAASQAFAAAGLSDDQLAAVSRLRDAIVTPAKPHPPLDLADREDALAAWLEEHDVDAAAAESLAESTVELTALTNLAATIDGPALAAAIRYLAADHALRRLASEIDMAASRIYTLVAAVKRFTYMDQAVVLKAVDVGQDLSDTMTILKSKARDKSVELRLDLAADLPRVQGFGGELNQVWTNLIDNAIDAAPPSGHVTVAAARQREFVVVRVIDDGPGIPEQNLGRIFDPFFTTKPVGQGTGLGLETARRLVNRHEGQIDVSAGSGGTEFCVTLPIAGPGSGGPA